MNGTSGNECGGGGEIIREGCRKEGKKKRERANAYDTPRPDEGPCMEVYGWDE